MGYSISASIKNKNLHKFMLRFLRNYYTHPKEFIFSSLPKSSLSYDSGKLKIGFDYKSSDNDELKWIYLITAWIAVEVGKRKDIDKYKQVPYLNYDGSEKIPIIKPDYYEDLPPNLKFEFFKLISAWNVNKFRIKNL